MDFEVPEKLRPVLAEMSAFVERELYPLERPFGERGFTAIEPALNGLRAQVRTRGLWAPQLPKDIGGMGLGLVEHGLVSEVLGRSPLGHYVFGCAAPDAGNAEILHLYGTPEQRERFLGPLARGEIRSCFSMTEPEHAGSNPTELSTRAVLDGGEWVIDGHKWFTSSADGAAFAIVMAITDPDAPRHRRASMILVPAATPGFTRVRNVSVMGHAGDGYFSHAEIRYRDCRVPAANLLGPRGQGFAIAQARLGAGRIHHCMRWLGICERAFDLMCRRALEREIAEGEALATRQIVQAWIAECRARIDAARLLVLRTAWRIDRGGFDAAREDVSLVKFHVAEVLQEVVDRAVQVHGALGLTDDTILASYYAHERGARIYDGPDEVHKIAAAKRILRGYRREGEGGAAGEPGPVRPGEALDLAKLAPFLEAKLGKKGDVEVRQYPGGHSNLTYLVRFAGESYVLRRPPIGSTVKTAHDMGREWRVLQALAGVYRFAPRPIAFADDAAILGAPFYLMAAVPGVVLRRDVPKEIALDERRAARLCESFVDALVELHAVDWTRVGLGDFGRPEGYVERQIEGWTRRYRDARTDEIPEIERVTSWLASEKPPSGPACLLHNDYKLDNVVLDRSDPSLIRGILDWEMSAVGDPLMDLGTTLCYWVEKDDPEDVQRIRFGPTQLPGMMTRRDLVESYARKSGREVNAILFYRVFGLFKTAVVAQQIYRRYRDGKTRDPRFATFGDAVRTLVRQASAAIERGGL